MVADEISSNIGADSQIPATLAASRITVYMHNIHVYNYTHLINEILDGLAKSYGGKYIYIT